MKKRLLALILTLIMVVSILPTSILADGNNRVYDDKETAIEETGVTANKTVSGPDAEGNYTITLSVKGNTTTVPGTVNLPADIVLVVDTSTSMEDKVNQYKTCGGTLKKSEWSDGYYCPNCYERYTKDEANEINFSCTEKIKMTRLDVAKSAAAQFASGLMGASDQVKMGLYDFSNTNRTKVSLTDDKETILDAIDGLHTPSPGDGTNYGVGLSGASEILNASESNRQKFVVFISDGEPTKGSGTEQADQLKKAGVTIMTVGVDMDRNALWNLQKISSKKNDDEYYCFAASSDGSSGEALDSVLALIQEEIEESIYSGTDAVFTDVINSEDFSFVEGSCTGGLDEENATLTWEIGTIGSGEQ